MPNDNTARDRNAGKRLGNYRIIREVGRGGMGAVFEATQLSMERTVALKLLPLRHAQDASFIARFRREAQAAGRLRHPNLISVFDCGKADAYHYIAMEFVPGRTLKRILLDDGPLTEAIAVTYMRALAAALGAAHAEGIIHRDVKPENVILDALGEPRLGDLGLAKPVSGADDITHTGTMLGTPLYIPPEQAQSFDVDGRADIYSLAASFHHLVSGDPLFSGPTSAAVAIKHVNDAPPPIRQIRSDISPGFEQILLKCLAKNPAQRYQSARALIEDLDRLLAGQIPMALARAEERSRRAHTPSEQLSDRRKLLIGGGIAVALLVAIIVAIATDNSSQAIETTESTSMADVPTAPTTPPSSTSAPSRSRSHPKPVEPTDKNPVDPAPDPQRTTPAIAQPTMSPPPAAPERNEATPPTRPPGPTAPDQSHEKAPTPPVAKIKPTSQPSNDDPDYIRLLLKVAKNGHIDQAKQWTRAEMDKPDPKKEVARIDESGLKIMRRNPERMNRSARLHNVLQVCRSLESVFNQFRRHLRSAAARGLPVDIETVTGKIRVSVISLSEAGLSVTTDGASIDAIPWSDITYDQYASWLRTTHWRPGVPDDNLAEALRACAAGRFDIAADHLAVVRQRDPDHILLAPIEAHLQPKLMKSPEDGSSPDKPASEAASATAEPETKPTSNVPDAKTEPPGAAQHAEPGAEPPSTEQHAKTEARPTSPRVNSEAEAAARSAWTTLVTDLDSNRDIEEAKELRSRLARFSRDHEHTAFYRGSRETIASMRAKLDLEIAQGGFRHLRVTIRNWHLVGVIGDVEWLDREGKPIVIDLKRTRFKLKGPAPHRRMGRRQLKAQYLFDSDLTTRFTIPPVPQDSRLTYVATIDLGKRRLLPYGARITSSSIPLSIQFAASHNSHDWIPLLTLPYLNRGVVGYAPARTHVPPGDWARFTFPTPEHALRPRVRLSKKATTWPEAQRWCELNGYRLAVSLTDAQVVDLCRRHGESDGYQVWVGARARDGGAVLIDGTPARRSIAEEHLTAAQDDCGLALELTNNDAVHPHYVVPRTPLRFLYTFATPRPGSLEHLLDQSWAVHRRDTHQDALCVLFKREFRSATSGEVHKDGGWTALGTWRFENGTLHITSDIHGLPRSYPYIWDVQRSAWVNKSQTTLLEPIRPLP